jgi:hypothetical protein
MRAQYAYLESVIITDMVRAYGAQNQLPGSSMKMVEKTIRWNNYFHPDKFSNFHELAKLLREYNGHKLELVSQRVTALQKSIGHSVVSGR